jgi:hypothetical protein
MGSSYLIKETNSMPFDKSDNFAYGVDGGLLKAYIDRIEDY